MTTTSDYYIETIDTGTRPHPWSWELRRRSKPMGIDLAQAAFNRKQRRSMPENLHLIGSSGPFQRRRSQAIASLHKLRDLVDNL
jgi:hypothetical protein